MTTEVINGQLLVEAEAYNQMKEGYVVVAVIETGEIVAVWGKEEGRELLTEDIDNAVFYSDRKEARRTAVYVESRGNPIPEYPDAEMEVKKALLAVQFAEETPILFTSNKPATETKAEETGTTIEGAEPKVE
jgi:hypothetical protein